MLTMIRVQPFFAILISNITIIFLIMLVWHSVSDKFSFCDLKWKENVIVWQFVLLSSFSGEKSAIWAYLSSLAYKCMRLYNSSLAYQHFATQLWQWRFEIVDVFCTRHKVSCWLKVQAEPWPNNTKNVSLGWEGCHETSYNIYAIWTESY